MDLVCIPTVSCYCCCDAGGVHGSFIGSLFRQTSESGGASLLACLLAPRLNIVDRSPPSDGTIAFLGSFDRLLGSLFLRSTRVLSFHSRFCHECFMGLIVHVSRLNPNKSNTSPFYWWYIFINNYVLFFNINLKLKKWRKPASQGGAN